MWHGTLDEKLIICEDSRFELPPGNGGQVVLGGVMVIMLSIKPKLRGFKPGQIEGFLRMIKICSTPFSEGK
jgi:hypothetical protein